MPNINQINNIVVVGSGVMDHGIGQVALMAGFNVCLIDIRDDIVNNAIENIKKGLTKAKNKGMLLEEIIIEDLMTRCRASRDLPFLVKDADFVFEAVVEDLKIKKKFVK